MKESFVEGMRTGVQSRSMMSLRLVFFGACLLLASCSTTPSTTPRKAALTTSLEASGSSVQLLSEFLDVPAVFSRMVGDLKIQFISSSVYRKPEVEIEENLIGRWRRIAVFSPPELPRRVQREVLATELMTSFYEKFLSRKMREGFELGRLSPEEVIATGVRRLLGQPVANPVANAWWNVRMESVSESSAEAFQSDYVLFVTNNIGPFDVLKIGHVSAGVRRLGGDPKEDFTLDFRAPTAKDYESSFWSLVFGDPALINGIRAYNFWDWVHVQKNNRKVDIWAQVYRLTDAQAILLRDYQSWPEEYTSGEFTLLGNNCAALSREFFDAILPFDQPLERSFSPVALPRDVVKEVEQRFPLLAKVNFEAQEISEDEEKTPVFVIESLQDRKSFPSFQKYGEFEGRYLR